MSRTGTNSDAGLTLLEVLVVMAILSLASIIIAVSLPQANERSKLAHMESQILGVLADAQAGARRSASVRRVVFELDERRFKIDGEPMWHPIPEGVDLSIVSAQELGTSRRAVVMFLSDGTSSGAEFSLVSGVYAIKHRVDWLSGRVRNAPQ
ncbi:prepilin-type N-terminal cleavage/methylation domain-containing protein [Microvirga terricola]|uniref:Prepilin-type N-terminal cleavage/methylation domain-containing protein n=1 Tax=Microvirga terricola TaxID=2719797 RepID=A0ABX0VF13_9HYPH|nr:prepilin-type N-terminal cleavage/methylation domain-containing protein [Microvirga terricola]NIX78434.1 prepilin-type N-terminal cleavage/methylation domain-containing protein [Microvirga terricola]